VSSDKDATQFEEYYGEMPWLALPFSDRQRKEALSQFFGVSGIPHFVMVSPALKAGLYKLNPVDMHSLKAPGFSP
jgi:nucleoredoxin